MRRGILLGIVALCAFLPARGSAQVINLFANLTTGQEPTINSPTNSTTGLPRATPFGFATFEINAAHTSMTFFATIFNLDVNGTQTPSDINDDLVAAHIHASSSPIITTASVVWGFFGSPFNDNNPNDFVLTPFVSGVGGTFSGKWDAPEGNGTTFAAQLDNILAGRSYINFHTRQNTGGEIRGALVVVPEPASIAMVSLGLVTLAIGARRRLRSR